MELTSAAVLIATALAVFGISYYYFTTRHRERMTVLEKGLPGDFFKGTYTNIHFILVLGIVSIGVAVGIGMVALLRSLQIESIDKLAFPLMIFFFLGVSLIVSYFILKGLLKKE